MLLLAMPSDVRFAPMASTPRRDRDHALLAAGVRQASHAAVVAEARREHVLDLALVRAPAPALVQSGLQGTTAQAVLR